MELPTFEQVGEMVKAALPVLSLVVLVAVLALFGIYAWRRWGAKPIRKPVTPPLSTCPRC